MSSNGSPQPSLPAPVPELPGDCDGQLCAFVSRRAGEETVGTAPRARTWLLFELALPWPRNLFEATARLPGLSDVLTQAEHAGHSLRALAITPQGDLNADQVRVLVLREPDGAWARLDKREYVAPRADVAALAAAVLDGSALPAAQERPTGHVRELLVCTHGNVDAACAKLGYPLYRELREHHVPASGGTLRAWRCSHFGGHRFAPTVLDFPSGRAWAHLDTERLRQVLEHTGDPTDLHPHHRGWSGADLFGQYAERAAFEREGWDWLTFARQGTTVNVEGEGEPLTATDPPRAADVRLDFVRPDGSPGAYAARVELVGPMPTLDRTGGTPGYFNRYAVTRLEAVPPT